MQEVYKLENHYYFLIDTGTCMVRISLENKRVIRNHESNLLQKK